MRLKGGGFFLFFFFSFLFLPPFKRKYILGVWGGEGGWG